MPSLRWRDVAADEFTVDKLGAFASGTTGTAHPALRHERCQSPPAPAMLRAVVRRLGVFPPEPPAPRRAESLVLREGRELTPAVVAPALPEADSSSERRRASHPAGGAELLISVARIEIFRAAMAVERHAYQPAEVELLGWV